MIDHDPLNEYLPELDPVVQLTDEAWKRAVKGTWSTSDKRIFAMGFREGWLERGRQIKKAMDADLEERRLIQSGMDGRGGF